MRAWGGIASLELSLSAVWTGARRRERVRLRRAFDLIFARWMSAAPAALAGLGDRKGRIEAGLDADLVVWDPDAEFTVDPARLQQRHKLTPYAGRPCAASSDTTFVRGERVWDEDGARARRTADGFL